jgi:hypothetical protein
LTVFTFQGDGNTAALREFTMFPHRIEGVIRHWRVVLLMLVGFCQACEATKLPTAPSELATGIVIYEHANFQGAAAHITSDMSDLRNVDGPCEHESSGEYSTTRIYNWNDCISSVRVAAGWSATLYRGTGYEDDSLELVADAPNLQLVAHDCSKDGLNDCVSSIRVRRR